MKRKPKNPITKIRTGNGDSGYTSFNGHDILKNTPVIEFLGNLDESCCSIAKINFDNIEDKSAIHFIINRILAECQSMLFDMGAMVYSPEALNTHKEILTAFVEMLDKHIQNYLRTYPECFVELNGFIIPSDKNADTMIARAVVRKAERSAVTAECLWAIPALNILSDFLFLVAWLQDGSKQWVGIGK